MFGSVSVLQYVSLQHSPASIWTTRGLQGMRGSPKINTWVILLASALLHLLFAPHVWFVHVCVCVSALLEYNQSVLVSRKDPESRKKAVADISERLTSNGRWPQVSCSTTGWKQKALLLFSFLKCKKWPSIMKMVNNAIQGQQCICWTPLPPRVVPLFILHFLSNRLLTPTWRSSKWKDVWILFNRIQRIKTSRLHILLLYMYISCRWSDEWNSSELNEGRLSYRHMRGSSASPFTVHLASLDCTLITHHTAHKQVETCSCVMFSCTGHFGLSFFEGLQQINLKSIWNQFEFQFELDGWGATTQLLTCEVCVWCEVCVPSVVLNVSSSLLARCWCFLREPQRMGEPWSGSNQVINNTLSQSPGQSFSVTPVGMSGTDTEGLGPLSHMIHFFVWSSVTHSQSPVLSSLFSALSPGAFLAGVPVQPVLLHYPNKLVGEVNEGMAGWWWWRGGILQSFTRV